MDKNIEKLLNNPEAGRDTYHTQRKRERVCNAVERFSGFAHRFFVMNRKGVEMTHMNLVEMPLYSTAK